MRPTLKQYLMDYNRKNSNSNKKSEPDCKKLQLDNETKFDQKLFSIRNNLKKNLNNPKAYDEVDHDLTDLKKCFQQSQLLSQLSQDHGKNKEKTLISKAFATSSTPKQNLRKFHCNSLNVCGIDELQETGLFEKTLATQVQSSQENNENTLNCLQPNKQKKKSELRNKIQMKTKKVNFFQPPTLLKDESDYDMPELCDTVGKPNKKWSRKN